MLNSFPQFRYHPDPAATGSIVASDDECMCCSQRRGFVYTASIYGIERPEGSLCPWCIASGEAARKFGIEFSDGHPLSVAGVPAVIVEEIMLRTPGFASWQQERWMSCCGDACEFHGDAPRSEIRSLLPQAFLERAKGSARSVDDFGALRSSYEPGGNPSIHKFVCRHCEGVWYDIDGT